MASLSCLTGLGTCHCHKLHFNKTLHYKSVVLICYPILKYTILSLFTFPELSTCLTDFCKISPANIFGIKQEALSRCPAIAQKNCNCNN